MKIQVLNNISKAGLDILEENKFVICGENEEDFSGIVLRSKNIFEAKYERSLFAISRAGAGTNNINVQNCSEKGIVVFNTPGANSNAVKELVICGMLLSSRGIIQGNAFAKSLTDKDEVEINNLMEKEKKSFKGNELKGKVLGIVGLGSDGSLLAHAASVVGMKIIGYDQ